MQLSLQLEKDSTVFEVRTVVGGRYITCKYIQDTVQSDIQFSHSIMKGFVWPRQPRTAYRCITVRSQNTLATA